jgi:hypothetical protein
MGMSQTLHAAGQVSLRLVSARNQLEGSLVSNQAVYADRERIYLASYQGKLFVLARNRSANFPLLQVIQDTSAPLTAVRGDLRNLYVTSADGVLRVYRKSARLARIATLALSSFGLSAVAVKGTNLYVAKGQGQLAVSGTSVYVAELNEGDIGMQIATDTLIPQMISGQTFDPYMSIAFSQNNGARIGSAPTPFDLWGQPAQPVLYANDNILAQTVPGCCGPGIFLHDPNTLKLKQFIPRLYTNTVTQRGQWLIAGNEGGQVDVFDLARTPSPLVASLDLRTLTGHTGSEDIEIRALWNDGIDNLIFAGSSWGNEQVRSPSLPSFFVFELISTSSKIK